MQHIQVVGTLLRLNFFSLIHFKNLKKRIIQYSFQDTGIVSFKLGAILDIMPDSCPATLSLSKSEHSFFS